MPGMHKQNVSLVRYLQNIEAAARQLAHDDAEAAAIVVKALEMALELSDVWPEEDRHEDWLISLAYVAHHRILEEKAVATGQDSTDECSDTTHFPYGFPILQ